MFQFNLEMYERSPFANEHENRTAKDAFAQRLAEKEERRRSDRCLKLQLMVIASDMLILKILHNFSEPSSEAKVTDLTPTSTIA
ncbi:MULTISPECIES: hypothetical protein [Nostoc]|uniref:Uncharacterized protein n=2 Tax=Nostoc TaxID=1177 RepID=A0ABR8I9U1_9NOSO|nr:MULTISPECIES: hypothetical protein [Nostoc]MBD2562576.1 hypothetical protein [Nostoc linckia FACHB-391]MBD2647614.1 hypothetical protein [Nostoc foliaceum FACHB-393]